MAATMSESLYEDEGFDSKLKKIEASFFSLWNYYLENHNDSLSYALKAGSFFDVSEDSDHVHTVLAKAIDEYASLRRKAAVSKEDSADVDPRLEAIVERMLDRCISDGKYQQAIGISIECRRMDKLAEAIISSDNVHATLEYCMNIFEAWRKYRGEVIPKKHYKPNHHECISWISRSKGQKPWLSKKCRF